MSPVLVEFAAALVDPGMPVPEGVVGRQKLADSKRFAVYRNNVHVSLVEALGKRYPVVKRLVGEDFFRAMARAYVGLNKPKSPVLLAYGADFAAFVAGFPPASGLPYLADVARLESAWLEAYHAADALPLTLMQLAVVPVEQLPDLRFAPHPSTGLVSSAYAIGQIWAAHQQIDVAPVRAMAAETVLVVRPGDDVGLHVLPAADVEFARCLLAGGSFIEAATLAGPGCDPSTALTGLVELGAFQSLIEGRA